MSTLNLTSQQSVRSKIPNILTIVLLFPVMALGQNANDNASDLAKRAVDLAAGEKALSETRLYAKSCAVFKDPPSCWTGVHNDDVARAVTWATKVLPLPTPVKQLDINTVNTLAKAIDDAERTRGKALDDTARAIDKAAKDTKQAGKALGRFINRWAIDAVEYKGAGLLKVADGKVLDGLWDAAIAPAKATDQDAARAIQESPLLNTVGQIASTVYGGPAGSAAYASWATYKMTGNPNLALKAGVISGATTWAMSGVSEMPEGTPEEVIHKTVVGGAIAGMAVAAAGGDPEHVDDAFLKGALMVLVQTGYKQLTTKPFDPKGQIATREGYCMLNAIAECRPPAYVQVKDSSGKVEYADPVMFKPTDTVVNYVGLQATGPENPAEPQFWISEQSPMMTAVGRVPPWNTMALAHDHLVLVLQLGDAAKVASIAPAIILTYAGSGAGVYSDIQNAVTASSTKNQERASAPPGAKTSAIDPYTVATCMLPSKPRFLTTIAVEFPPPKSSRFICTVKQEFPKSNAYTKGEALSPWYAAHDASFCAVKGIELAAQLTKEGYVCVEPQQLPKSSVNVSYSPP